MSRFARTVHLCAPLLSRLGSSLGNCWVPEYAPRLLVVGTRRNDQESKWRCAREGLDVGLAQISGKGRQDFSYDTLVLASVLLAAMIWLGRSSEQSSADTPFMLQMRGDVDRCHCTNEHQALVDGKVYMRMSAYTCLVRFKACRPLYPMLETPWKK